MALLSALPSSLAVRSSGDYVAEPPVITDPLSAAFSTFPGITYIILEHIILRGNKAVQGAGYVTYAKFAIDH